MGAADDDEEIEDDERRGPVPWRLGGDLGFSVDAASFPDSTGSAMEIYVRIPPVTLQHLVSNPKTGARIRLSLKLRNRYGARAYDKSQEFVIAPGDSGGGFGKVVMFRTGVKPGSHALTVRLEDLGSRKRGLAYIGRNVPQSREVTGDVVVPAAQAGREISDIEFVWSHLEQSSAGAFAHEGRASLPNPDRLYGLFATDLRASFVARAPVGSARPWRWVARLYDASGAEVAHRDSVTAAAAMIQQDLVLDISALPAGGYDLEVRAWQEGDSGAVVRRARCSIAWLVSSWSQDPSDVEDAVHFLLSAEQEKAFAKLLPGERERFLEDFWAERDPTPGTAENEERIAFARRVQHANANWGRFGLGKGMFSDMGRVYIRYGEPDEIHRQVIPAGDQTLSQAILALELTEDRGTGDVHAKGPGGDTRPFEVWIYEWDARRAQGQSGPTTSRRRIVFLFVDEQGYGDYTLRYSTE